MNDFGFIITRHVKSEKTNRYWNHSVKLLKTLYPNKKIVIIDDNSNQYFVKPEFEYKNVEIVNSEFPGSGEILPYYYFLKNKYFENAVILHDSVFFHKRIPFEAFSKLNVLPLWYFNADKENIENTLKLTNCLNNCKIFEKKLTLNDGILGMSHNKWYGCFGSQAYINYNFLLGLNNRYNITNLVRCVKNRPDRCCLERILGCIFYTEDKNLFKFKALFGDIMQHQKWCDYSFDKYMSDLKKGTLPKAVVKVWTGR
jgi:hypothetical protein